MADNGTNFGFGYNPPSPPNYGFDQPNIDAAVAQGLDAPAIPVAPDPMQAQAPGQVASAQPGQPNFNFSVQPAQFLQNRVPTDADFYATPDMVRGQGAEGPIITARAPYVSMGVLANRQAELDRKKEQLAKDRLAFDPYSGIGKASDPYQPAFQKYATGEIDRYRKERADALYGGDLQKMDDAIRTNPQEGAAFKRFAGGIEAIGIANKGLHKQVADTYADVMAGTKQLPPDMLKEFADFLSVQDENGVPIKGTNSQELLMKHRNADALASNLTWYDKIAQPSLAQALQTIVTSGPITRDKSGKLLLTEQEIKTFDGAKDALVDQSMQAGQFDGDRKKARAFLDAMLPTSIKTTVKMENPVPAPSGSGRGSGSTDGKIRFSSGLTPTKVTDEQRTERYGGVIGPATENVPTISLSEDTGGKFKQLTPRTFDMRDGVETRQVTLASPQIKFIDGEWNVVGTPVSDMDTQKLQDVLDAGGADDPRYVAMVQKILNGKTQKISLDDATPYLKSYLGDDFSVDDIVSKKAAEKGYDWDQSKFDGWTKDQKQKAMTNLFK